MALVGRNGAGKSTTLRVLAGVLPPSSGTVRVAGVDVVDDPVAARHVSGYCPDVGGLVPRATPWEHLQLAARLRGVAGWEAQARDLLERFDLAAAAHRVTAGFSHGMGRRLSVVLAAFHRPAVLLLDEPFDGVDPLGVQATLDLVAGLRAAGHRRPGLHAPARARGAGLRRRRGPARRVRRRRGPGERARRRGRCRPLPRAARLTRA